MANIKIVRLIDSMYGNGAHSFSIIASDTSARYIFPEGQEAFDGAERISRIIEARGGVKPTTVNGWLNVALFNLNSYVAEEIFFDKPYKTVKDAVNSEQKALKERNLGSTGLRKSEQKMNIAADTLLSDPDFEAFSYGESDEMPEDAEKAFIVSMIDGAGTRDLNPWLEPWLAGQTEGLDFSKGLVLNRYNTEYKYEEPETKEKD
jgi:hypothetical protein